MLGHHSHAYNGLFLLNYSLKLVPLDSDPNKPDHESPAHQPSSPLASGILNIAPGQGIAWCEMARGLLLHWVQLDAAGKVADYRVIAPTEWNFHPEGALARAVRALPPDDTASAWVLAAAYDACVACSVSTP